MQPNHRINCQQEQSAIRLITQAMGRFNQLNFTVKDLFHYSKNHQQLRDLMFGSPNRQANITQFGQNVLSYISSRENHLYADILPLLMDYNTAEQEYLTLSNSFQHTVYQPTNRQAQHNGPAYLACMVNLQAELVLGNGFDDNPSLPVSSNNLPLYIGRRKPDGAYPTLGGVQHFWEVKEFYIAARGSRLTDIKYEVEIDHLDALEVSGIDNLDVAHYLFIDGIDLFNHNHPSTTLREMCDLLNFGLVNQVFFGREVLTEWPALLQSW